MRRGRRGEEVFNVCSMCVQCVCVCVCVCACVCVCVCACVFNVCVIKGGGGRSMMCMNYCGGGGGCCPLTWRRTLGRWTLRAISSPSCVRAL